MSQRVREFRRYLVERYGTAPDNESITVALAEASRKGETAPPSDIVTMLVESGVEEDLASESAGALSRLPLPITRDAFSYREALDMSTRCATCEHYVEELPGRLGACVMFARLGEAEPGTFLLLEDVGNHMLCDLWEPGETDQGEPYQADEDFDLIEYAKQWRPFNTHNNTVGAVNVDDPMDKLYGEEARQALEGPGGAVQEHGPNYDKHLAAAKKAWETMRARWGEAAQEYLQALIGQERDVMMAVAAKLEGKDFGVAGLRFIAKEIGLGDQVPKKATREQLLELILAGLRKQVGKPKADTNPFNLPPRPDFQEWARTKHLDPLVQVAEYKFGQALVKHIAENVKPATMNAEGYNMRVNSARDRWLGNVITHEQYKEEKAAIYQELREAQAKPREVLLRAIEVPPEQRLRTVIDGVRPVRSKKSMWQNEVANERKGNAAAAFEDLRRIIGQHIVERVAAPEGVGDDAVALRVSKDMMDGESKAAIYNKDSLTFKVTSRSGRSDYHQRLSYKDKIPPKVRKGWEQREAQLRLAMDNYHWANANPDQPRPEPFMELADWQKATDELYEEKQAYRQLHPFINLRSSSRTTAYHEIGHWIEFRCPGAQIAVNRFLNARLSRGNQEPVPMRRFGRGYAKYEIGKKDEFDKYFTDPSRAYYTGKTYPDGATEVLSMGVQALLSDPVGFCQKDPEYACFVIGILTGDLRRA